MRVIQNTKKKLIIKVKMNNP